MQKCFEIKKRPYEVFAYYENVFSEIECTMIKDLGIAKGLTRSKTLSDSELEDEELFNKSRKSYNSWIDHCSQSSWIFDRLQDIVFDANEQWWNFDLIGYGEGMQFTRYQEGHFYSWHTDSTAYDTSQRKISAVINLSHPNEYQGGELQFFGLRDRKVCNDLGSVIIFPSHEYHRVKAVTSGTRYSLVSWISGPPLK